MDAEKIKIRLDGKVRALEKNTQENKIASPMEATLVPNDFGYKAFSGGALDIIRENLKNQPFSFQLFDLVKSPSGGSTVFSVPGISGDEAEKELTGIILDYTTPRAHWDTPDPVEGTPPVCLSRNSIYSDDGKQCILCPFNDFGSKDGESNAKACKESVLIFLLRKDSIIPLLIRVPVTSKVGFLKYTTRLAGAFIPISGVITKITLKKATSKSGKPYALYHFDAVKILSKEEAARAKSFSHQFMEILNVTEGGTILPQADNPLRI